MSSQSIVKSEIYKMPQEQQLEVQPKDKLKILCLHGYRQNATAFKSKLGSFRKLSSKYVELTFLEAPHQAPPLPEQGSDSTHKSWWFNKDDGTFKGTNKSGPALGFEESLRLVEKTWTEGSFDGLLGFSQGGCFVGLISAMAELQKTSIRPSFVIIVAGFQSGSLAHFNYTQERISMPALLVYGESDEIIPCEMSQLLADQFENKQVIRHPGGHFFPASSEHKPKYNLFLQDRLVELLEARELKESKNLAVPNPEDSSPSSNDDSE